MEVFSTGSDAAAKTAEPRPPAELGHLVVFWKSWVLRFLSADSEAFLREQEIAHPGMWSSASVRLFIYMHACDNVI